MIARAAFIYRIYVQETMSKRKVQRRTLRDCSNPLEMVEEAFIAQFRLNKESFQYVLEVIKPHLLTNSIPPIIHLAATLRFLAEGGYQRSVGNDFLISLGRSTVSKILWKTVKVLEDKLCPIWINLKMSNEEEFKSKRHFYNKHKIPGVVGCIDGTHIKILKPVLNEHLYYNRKGYFSINAMLICDYNLMVRTIDAGHPGSSHDSFVWNLSSARNYVLSQYQGGKRNFWLLGDAGYGIEPFLITPFRDPEPQSTEHNFNLAHSSARNVVERTIGVLKCRFRCLLGTLQYTPQKCVQIVNVCCALHNICREYKVQYDEIANLPINESEDITSIDPLNEDSSLLNEGQRIRSNIANNL